MHCNGKCQLMQKIKAQEERERGPAPELKQAAKAEVLSSRSFFPATPAATSFTSVSPFYLHNSGHPVDRSFAFFHPPDAA